MVECTYSLSQRRLQVLEEFRCIDWIIGIGGSGCLALMLHSLLSQDFFLNVQRKSGEELGIDIGHGLSLLKSCCLLGSLTNSLLSKIN